MGGIINITSVPLSKRLEIIKVGNAEITHTAGTETVNTIIQHGLGFSPLLYGMYDLNGDETQFVPLPYVSVVTSGSAAGLTNITLDGYVSSTEVIFTLSTPDFAGSGSNGLNFNVYIKYYLLRETSN